MMYEEQFEEEFEAIEENAENPENTEVKEDDAPAVGERSARPEVDSMSIDERHEAILAMLSARGRISTSDVEAQFGVSFDTARRDLRILESRGKLRRTRGGALPMLQVGLSKPKGVTFRDISEVRPNYWEIAKAAAAMIRPHDVVYITHATVGAFLVRNLPADLAFTAVTNSILLAEELRQRSSVRVIMAGGEMDEKGNCCDAFSREMIRRMRFDKCFVTSACISAEFGLSIQRSAGVDFLNAVLDASKEKIGLYPTEKLGQTSILSICPASRLDVLIVDWNAEEDELDKYEELGIDVQMVMEPNSQKAAEQAGKAAAEDLDPLLEKAIAVAREGHGAYTSLLQRKLSIGYGRAKKLIDQMVEQGVEGVYIPGRIPHREDQQ